MPNMSAAYQWAINTCNNPNVGYSQIHREQETIDGITYYDCSSFIWYALQAGGFSLTPPPFTTSGMISILQSIGFSAVNINGLWAAGDILWRPGHTEMVYSGGTGQGITMGAHGSSYPLEDQVSINSYVSSASSWTYLFRYSGGAPTRQWIRGTASQYFTTEQMQNNALCLRDWFVTYTDWSLNAIAGMAGNIQGESTFNPDSMEHPNLPIGTVGRDGIGLVQWTTDTAADGNPLFMILTYLYGAVTDWGDPVGQCNAIMAEYGKSTGTIPPVTDPDFPAGWIATSSYPLSFSEWAHSTADPGYLALAFQADYERPQALDPDRAGWARTWYQYFLDNPYSPPGPTRQSKLKVWQMIRYHY